MSKKKNTHEDQPIPAAAPKPRTGSRHKDRTTISLKGELYSRLAELARRNRRPIQWEARLALERHVNAKSRPTDIPGEEASESSN